MMMNVYIKDESLGRYKCAIILNKRAVSLFLVLSARSSFIQEVGKLMKARFDSTAILEYAFILQRV